MHHSSCRFDELWRGEGKLCLEDAVPEPAGHTEAVLVVGEVMLKVISLEFAVIPRKAGDALAHGRHLCKRCAKAQIDSPVVMQEIMGQVVTDVAEYSTAKGGHRGVPVVVEHAMCQVPERYGQDNEQCRWHDQSQTVHGQVMMNAM